LELATRYIDSEIREPDSKKIPGQTVVDIQPIEIRMSSSAPGQDRLVHIGDLSGRLGRQVKWGATFRRKIKFEKICKK
jgi:hypothetical protein